jgi:nicotinate-nucleotide adenylyltransferase
VVKLARIGVVSRPGSSLADAEGALERVGGRDRAEIVDIPEIGVSSSRIRGRVAAGRPIRHLVTDQVLDFIETKGLYRA